MARAGNAAIAKWLVNISKGKYAAKDSRAALLGFAEQALGPKQKDREQQAESDCIAHGRADISHGKNLSEAEKKTAEQGAADIPHPTEDHDRDPLVQHRLSHAAERRHWYTAR